MIEIKKIKINKHIFSALYIIYDLFKIRNCGIISVNIHLDEQ